MIDKLVATELWRRPEEFWPRLTTATSGLPAPVGVLESGALAWNRDDLLRRARLVRPEGIPIRVASKSIRVREVLRGLLDHRDDHGRVGFAGILGYSLAEAVWLADHGFDDILVAYPSADRQAFSMIASRPELAERITIMIDSLDHLDWMDRVVAPQRRTEIRACLEVDVAFDLPGLRVGVYRSPVRRADDAGRLARLIGERRGVRLVGVMAYEAQLAGVGDKPLGGPMSRARLAVIQQLQKRSLPEVHRLRQEAVAAVGEWADLEFVNGGGTGSIESTAADESVTEVAAGSGIFGAALFDRYRHFAPAPAASFALDVVRSPQPGMVTLHGGGWIASGPAEESRQPVLTWPRGLRTVGEEGAGEVQTPVRGAAADTLRLGDRVWLRHAKAGELSEHLNRFAVVDAAAGTLIDELDTYRGEGRDFL